MILNNLLTLAGIVVGAIVVIYFIVVFIKKVIGNLPDF